MCTQGWQAKARVQTCLGKLVTSQRAHAKAAATKDTLLVKHSLTACRNKVVTDNTKQSTRAQGTEACNAAKEKWEKEKVSEAAWCTRRHQKEIKMQQTGVTYGMDCDTAGLPVIVCVSKPEQPLQAQDQLEHLCSDYISMMDCHHVRHNIGCMFDCMCWQLL